MICMAVGVLHQTAAAAGLVLFITAASGNAQRLSGALATHLVIISLGIA